MSRNLSGDTFSTLAETLTGFEAEHWYGVFAPADTPARVVSLLSEKLASGVAISAHSEVLASRGLRPAHLGAAAFSAKLASERARWAPLIARRGGASGT